MGTGVQAQQPIPQPIPQYDPSSHPANKPGWKTSEFWLTGAFTLASIFQTFTQPTSGAAIASQAVAAGALAAYNASRAYAKANAPMPTVPGSPPPNYPQG